MRYLLFTPLLLISLAFACGGDDDSATPTSSPDGSPSSALDTPAVITTTPEPALTPAPTATTEAHDPGSTDDVDVTPVPDPPTGTSLLVDVRVGAHPELGGWDRIVFEFDGSIPPGVVRYVDSLSECGSGFPVELEGQALLEVSFNTAAAHNEAGDATIDETEIQGPGNSILESRQICDFEAEVTWAVGVTGLQNFTVVQLADPPRVVVDIKN